MVTDLLEFQFEFVSFNLTVLSKPQGSTQAFEGRFVRPGEPWFNRSIRPYIVRAMSVSCHWNNELVSNLFLLRILKVIT